MAVTPKKSKAEIATIDVSLVTIKTAAAEFGFQTSSKIEVEPQMEEEDAVKLIVKGKLKAQKPKKVTLTGHEIKLTDNVFNPELVVMLQGGAIVYDTVTTTKIIGYDPPATGAEVVTEPFMLTAYSARYNAAGAIEGYEKIEYPNCVGQPVAFSAEDGKFRAQEYTIISGAKEGEKPYTLRYVDTLPVLAPTT